MLRRVLIVLSSLAMLFLAPAASAADLIGQASIIDGDTIEIHGQRIRLRGLSDLQSDPACPQYGMAAGEHNRGEIGSPSNLTRNRAAVALDVL